MASLRQRLDDIERKSPERKSVYEMTDEELIVGIGLPRGTTVEDACAHIREERMLARATACPTTAPGDATPSRHTTTGDHNNESKQ